MNSQPHTPAFSASSLELSMADAGKFFGWKLLAALSAIVSVNLGVAYVGASVINAPMARELGLSRGTLGLGSTVFVLSVGLGAPLVARVINSLGARLSLCIGSLFVAFGSILLASWVTQGWQYVVAYGLMLGLGCAFGALIPAQTCASAWFERRRALALALVLTGSGIGGLLFAPLLTRVIALADGNWRAAWYVVLVAALAAAAIALLVVKNRPADLGQQPDGAKAQAIQGGEQATGFVSTVYRTRERWTVRDAMRTPAFWLIGVAAVGESVPSVAAIAHAVPHLRDLGHSAEATAAALGLFAMCTIAGKLSVGFFCDRIEPRYAWSVSIVMMGLAVFVATHAQSAAAMYLFTGLLGFGSGAALTCWHSTVANYFGPTAFASILGALMPFSNAVAAASPFLVGLLYDRQGTYTMAFYAVSAVSIISALMLLAAVPPRQSPATQ
ncbi:MFS transporter [Peristeroidobacter soli]|uniref:MFS transporter n=1 Tax=Peristeroidobacter soli TaxID=2497877 RepID=UPI00101C3EE5|nr:MFS transporter [Peristeroidobacter soli]